VGIAKTDEEIEALNRIYDMICEAGIDVLFDDRKVSPGIKFADADLVGIPVRVTVGKGYFQKGEIEVKLRRSPDVEITGNDSLIEKLKPLIIP